VRGWILVGQIRVAAPGFLVGVSACAGIRIAPHFFMKDEELELAIGEI
jgi:hypothetical protein